VCKTYPNGFSAVTDLSLEINQGEFLVMVGPSGCGKSTTLRMIAGLEDISDGKLTIGDRVVNDVPPKDRDIAMVFQNYALYPHMTVADNIGFALQLRKTPRNELRERVAEAARILQITDLLDRKPGQLSGGQRQRVAMGRAIVRRPRVFLLDEPLSNLDAKLRVQTRGEITRIQREVGVTAFYVTHDQVEAMTMADRVAVINHGVLQQVAPPQDLFDKPENLFVAAFIGSPSMNLLEGRLVREGDRLTLDLGAQSLDAAGLLARTPVLESHLDRPLVFGLRPKELQDAGFRDGHPDDQSIMATAVDVEALGFEKIVYLDAGLTTVRVEDADDLGEDEPTSTIEHRIAGRFDPASTVRVGDQVKVNVNVENAHVFDPDSGEAIR